MQFHTGGAQLIIPGVEVVEAGGGAELLPFSDDFNRADGPIGNGWTGATWAISGNKAVNTPTLGVDLIVNGGFGADTNWTKGTDWTIAGGVAAKAAGAVSSNLTQAIVTVGQWYRIVWTVATYTAGSFFALFASSGNPAPARTALGSYLDTARVSVGNVAGVRANSPANGTVDNVSVRQITLATLFATQDYGHATVDALATGTVLLGTQAGVVVNLDNPANPQNLVVGFHDGLNVKLEKMVGGVWTNLISTAVTLVANVLPQVYRVPATNTYRLFYNGIQRGADITIADAGIIGNTNHGIISSYEGNQIDSFSILAS